MNELLDSINWAIFAPIAAIQLVLMIVALVNCVRQRALNGPKWMWVLIIIFINIIGPILYFVVGRRQE